MSKAENWDRRMLHYFTYYTKRGQGVPVNKIADDFGYDSPRALYKSLAQNHFPVCEVCGATPVGTDHCERPTKKRKAKSPNVGGVVELPPAREAIPLFKQIIGLPYTFLDGSLHRYITESGLHGYAEDLRDLEEELHGKRFVSNEVNRPEDGVGFEGSMMPLGAGKTPSKVLVVLIAVYALTREDFSPLVALYKNYKQLQDTVFCSELNHLLQCPPPTFCAKPPLVEKLHPDPASVDTEQLKSFRAKLQLAAAHMATVVRGGYVGKGAPTEGLSPKEAMLAYWIADSGRRLAAARM